MSDALLKQIRMFEAEALRLKRALFDAGFQTSHNHIAEAESLAWKAEMAMLIDPPIDSPLRTMKAQ